MILEFRPTPSIAHRAVVPPPVQPRHSLVPTATIHFCSKSLGRRGFRRRRLLLNHLYDVRLRLDEGHPPESAVPRTLVT